jgi:hypothetical protein
MEIGDTIESYIRARGVPVSESDLFKSFAEAAYNTPEEGEEAVKRADKTVGLNVAAAWRKAGQAGSTLYVMCNNNLLISTPDYSSAHPRKK